MKSQLKFRVAMIGAAAFFIANFAFVMQTQEDEKLSVSEICEDREIYSFHIPDPSLWAVVVTVNFGYLDHFRNWWYYFHKLNIDANLVAYAEDDKAFQTLTGMDLDGAIILNSGSNGIDADRKAFDYNTPEYNKLVTSRPSRLLSIFCSPIPWKSLIYADVDAVWLKDPIPYFHEILHKGVVLDLVAQDDNPDYPLGYCTGLMGMRCNDRIVKLLAVWEQTLIDNPGKPNQKLFWDSISDPLVSRIGVSHGALPILQFPPGNIYFDPDNTEQQRNKAIIVHNNWIVGSNNKTERFKKWNLWGVGSTINRM